MESCGVPENLENGEDNLLYMQPKPDPDYIQYKYGPKEYIINRVQNC
jgi:hypothetical protein